MRDRSGPVKQLKALNETLCRVSLRQGLTGADGFDVRGTRWYVKCEYRQDHFPTWVVGLVDDTGFPKQGEDSVGVARQCSGTLGKTGNCQVAVSLHHVGEQGNAVLGWRLYLPETWAKDKERRQAAGVPEEVVFKKKWELALDLIDQVRGWGVPNRLVLADAGYGEVTEFRDALEERDLRYAVGIAPTVGIWTKPPQMKHSTKTTGIGSP